VSEQGSAGNFPVLGIPVRRGKGRGWGKTSTPKSSESSFPIGVGGCSHSADPLLEPRRAEIKIAAYAGSR